MSIYTGFFDAAFDEATGSYDNSYDSADFTGYFGEIVGSGVCIRNNENSMQVYYDSGSNRAVVNPGYLFIRGYWLKNDGLYTVSLASLSAGTYAILAQLNLGSRAITIGQTQKADPESYPDALVLAYATISDSGAVSIEDTRSRTDICGLIDSAGSLSSKVEYAINYINNEIEGRLDQIEQQLQAQSAEIDGKIDEANALISEISPPEVGTIKFSASQDVGEDWLKCDGSFINEATYPELVAALGKNYPSGDEFQLLNTEGVGRQISNGVICEGRLWVFSYADRKLYGIDVEENTAPKVITLTGDANFASWKAPSDQYPLVLSIVESKLSSNSYKVFLAQFSTGANVSITPNIPDEPTATATFHPTTELFYTAEFNPESDSIQMMSVLLDESIDVFVEGRTVTGSRTITGILGTNAYPSVVSKIVDGIEIYLCMAYFSGATFTYEGTAGENGDSLAGYFRIRFDGSTIDASFYLFLYGTNSAPNSYGPFNKTLISGFLSESEGEAIVMATTTSSSSSSNRYTNGLYSLISGVYDRAFTDETSSIADFDSVKNIVAFPGSDWIVLQFNFTEKSLHLLSRSSVSKSVKRTVSSVELPPTSKGFMKAQAYLWGKNIYMFFVGTGILFSRTLEGDSFGYLDTTEVLGTITQFASLLYSQDEMTLYIVGQDTTNSIKAAKIVLNTLYDYASDGAWLPLIASDGVPAYIKAIGEPPPPEPRAPVVFSQINVENETGSGLPALSSIFNVRLNGETLVGATNKEYPASSVLEMEALQDYTNPQSTELDFRIFAGIWNGYQQTVIKQGQLLGRVLARGENIKKGDVVQTTLNMTDLFNAGITYFVMVTEAAQGS